MQDDELTLQEKEERWIKALRRKEELRTTEELDWELMSETLYEDDRFIFFKECGNCYTFRDKQAKRGMSSELDYFLESTMNEIMESNDWGIKTFLDFMKDKGFPITFKTWDD